VIYPIEVEQPAPHSRLAWLTKVTTMKPRELQQALRSVEPAAVLVTPRVLETIVRQTHNIGGLLGAVPQRATFIADRQLLFRHVEQEDLALEPDQVLPATVILLSWPTQEDMQHTPAQALLLKYWQRLFHASVHLDLDRLSVAGKLSLADIRQRMHQIGEGPFEEVRSVLTQDRYILAEADDRSLYLEFAALFLELYYFAPSILPSMFPSLRDPEAVKELLARDVDAQALFQRTRLPGAGDPISYTHNRSGEAHEFYWKLVADSDHALQSGNVVRAAIQRRKAARVAPAALGFDTRNEALELLYGLLSRLEKALELTGLEVEEWRKDIPTLLDKADQGSRAPEAALLHDLQRACLDHEREIYSVDLIEWIRSIGKRPIRRSLPSLRMVRLTRHLKSANQRLTLARLSDEDRSHLGSLLESAVQRSEERLRERFRPLLITALEDVGLSPRNPPERVSFYKMVEEFIDRVLSHGYVTFSDLRDIISRNKLKLPDLSDPQDFLRGDPLLRLDRRLGTLLDGVYKPSEFYLRWLERFTAWNFGTKVGRLLTLWVTLPLLLGYLMVKVPLLAMEALDGPELEYWAFYSLWFVAVVFVTAIMHSAWFRGRLREGAFAVFSPVGRFAVEAPRYVLRHPALKQFLISWPFQVFIWYLVKPAILCLLFYFLIPGALDTSLNWGLAFLAANFVINSRAGQALGQTVSGAIYSFVNLLRGGLLPGLVRLIVAAFKHVVYLFESLLFAIEDWLRFRGGENQAAAFARAILTALWYPISYFIRFNVVVLIEPGLNPLKLPICSLAAKLVYPVMAILWPQMVDALSPYLGSVLAGAIVWWFVFWSPDIAGFLFWEMKENWKLYRANRHKALGAMAIGPHGETLPRLLRPGFHSGSVPKIYRKLRRAERAALKSGNWATVRTLLRNMREIEENIRYFLEREFLGLLKQDPAWLGVTIDILSVHLATNRIDIEMGIGREEEKPIRLRFEERQGWLLAAFRDGAELERLSERQRNTLHNALIGLYKLSGVDLVEEQLTESLPSYPMSLRPAGLTFWMDERRTQGVYYDLRRPLPAYPPLNIEAEPVEGWPILDGALVFAHKVILWDNWVQTWRLAPQGGDPANRLLEASIPILTAPGPKRAI